MDLSRDQRHRLAGRARTLQERLDEPVPVDGTGDSPADGWTVDDPSEWIQEWRDRVADGDDEKFRRRLHREELPPGESLDRIRHDRWPPDEPLPDWVADVEALLGSVRGLDPSAVTPPFDSERPFDVILWAIVEHAEDELDGPLCRGVVTSAAADDLREWLYDRLHRLLVHPLFVEFKTYVARRDRDLVFGDPDPPGEPRAHYRAFVAALFDDGLREFLLEYAFLARLLAGVVRRWTEAVAEFRRRLREDHRALAERFSSGECGPVVGVEPNGDPHRGGRVVFRVTFRDGTRVAYKPRDVGPEAAFSSVLSWATERGLPEFSPLDCLERDGYGWVEWVDAEPCDTEADVEAYYRRAGALTCLSYALGFTDGHLENVVAAGDTPVVVDLETIAQPDPDPEKLPRSDPVRSLLRGSVLRTGLVPVHRPDAETRNASGFGSAGATASGVEVPEFTDVNTDLMEMHYRERRSLPGENLPRLDGDRVPPEGYVDELVAGFRDAYETLLDERETLLGDDGPLDALADASVRLVYRATSTYGSILASLTTPEYLRTGLAFGCKVEALARPIVAGRTDGDCWPVYEAERAALSRLDVPRFTVDTGDTDLQWDGRSIGGVVESTPMAAVRRRIRRLDPADCEEQVDYLRAGYGDASATGGTHAESVADADTTRSVEVETLRPAGPSERPDVAACGRRRAAAIADRIRDRADASGGDPVWYLREPTPDAGVYPHPVDDDLYHGRLGIGVFFAGLSAAGAGEHYGTFAADVAAPVYREAVGDASFDDRPLGGCEGVGSIVYGLTTLGRLLDEDRYLDAAGRVVATLTPERLAGSDAHDVFGGTAGAVLGALAHWRATGDRDSLDRAVSAGDHLRDASVDDEGPVWPDPHHGRWLTGFAHGSAGIAYALARLADASGATRFRETALAAIRREDRTYDPDAENWRDRRPGGEAFFDGWCNGRTGIGLARLGTDAHVDDPAVREGIDRALAGVDPTTLPPEDHLCCGTFGQVAFLRAAGRVRDDPDLVADARRMATASLRRADPTGFPVRWATDHWHNPTLFGGEAGVGYELLRFAEPSLPDPLLWK